MTNASNIRIFQTKREGAAPTFLMDTCNNVAYYSIGKLGRGASNAVPTSFYPGGVYALGGYINTGCTNVMIPSVTVFWAGAATQKLIYDQASGLSVDNQTQICLYLKGQIDDSVMGH
jgi:hypothetical protein